MSGRRVRRSRRRCEHLGMNSQRVLAPRPKPIVAPLQWLSARMLGWCDWRANDNQSRKKRCAERSRSVRFNRRFDSTAGFDPGADPTDEPLPSSEQGELGGVAAQPAAVIESGLRGAPPFVQ